MLSDAELNDKAGDGRRDIGRFTEGTLRLIDGKPVLIVGLTDANPVPIEGRLKDGMLSDRLTEGSPVPIEGKLIDGVLSDGRAIDESAGNGRPIDGALTDGKAIDGTVGEGKLNEIANDGRSVGRETLRDGEGRVRVGTASVGRSGMRLVQIPV